MQFVVQTACVADRVALFVPAPQRSHRGSAVLAGDNQSIVTRRRLRSRGIDCSGLRWTRTGRSGALGGRLRNIGRKSRRVCRACDSIVVGGAPGTAFSTTRSVATASTWAGTWSMLRHPVGDTSRLVWRCYWRSCCCWRRADAVARAFSWGS